MRFNIHKICIEKIGIRTNKVNIVNTLPHRIVYQLALSIFLVGRPTFNPPLTFFIIIIRTKYFVV